VGTTALSPELQNCGDVDTGVGIAEFYGGRAAYFYSSKMMAADQHGTTEIIGTIGKITVNTNPMTNLVEMSEPTGIRREIPPH